MIKAEVLADSISPQGIRLTTFQYTAPRLILAEINTHRVLSRNARSSRAVPTERLIKEVRENPAMPVFWGANEKGMQASEELTGDALYAAQEEWRISASRAVYLAERLALIGLHKQIANRVLEPFMWVHGVITATEWDNFFGLRLDKAAQPEFRALAEAMWRAREASEPRVLKPGEWHLPYVNAEDFRRLNDYSAPSNLHLNQNDIPLVLAQGKRQSAARCARVAYRPFDADRPSTLEEDLALCTRLETQGHWSPFEHQATPDEQVPVHAGTGQRLPMHEALYETPSANVDIGWKSQRLHGNLRGWVQFRKMFKGEDRRALPAERVE